MVSIDFLNQEININRQIILDTPMFRDCPKVSKLGISYINRLLDSSFLTLYFSELIGWNIKSILVRFLFFNLVH